MNTSTRPGLGAVGPTVQRGRRLNQDRRDQILVQLKQLILAEGFSTLTVDDIATRLQCSKSTLYAISSSKEWLVTKAIKTFFRDATAKIDEKVSPIQDPAERIAAYLAGIGEEMLTLSPTCYEDMVTHESTREIYALNSAAASRRVNAYIQDGLASGRFRTVHADFVGQAISLIIDGIQHGELLRSTGLSSGDAFNELSDLVLAALTNRQ